MHKAMAALEGRVHKAEATVATLQAEIQQRQAVAAALEARVRKAEEGNERLQAEMQQRLAVAADLEARVRALEAAVAVPQAVEAAAVQPTLDAEAVQPTEAANADAADIAQTRAPQAAGEPAAKRVRVDEESVMYDKGLSEDDADSCSVSLQAQMRQRQPTAAELEALGGPYWCFWRGCEQQGFHTDHFVFDSVRFDSYLCPAHSSVSLNPIAYGITATTVADVDALIKSNTLEPLVALAMTSLLDVMAFANTL
eukprot:TRINITY_DN17333_c0_g1_i1.p1 TRINITY_DN17333_c0_g1~~TRINITY_DN17333_c0_g1_i1.p1  ORF type:complete len:254 (+),score=81.56 TRINITY_DN17333_c0_g1_i1:521-1282(+)